MPPLFRKVKSLYHKKQKKARGFTKITEIGRKKMKNETTTFSEQFTKARKAAGLTQDAVAKLMRIPKRTIENWSTGKSSPPDWSQPLIIRELERLASEK